MVRLPSTSPHIGIIGAGLIGLSTAEALRVRGAKVTIWDRRPGPCEGTSFSNSGMIHPSQSISWDAAGDDPAAFAAARDVVDLAKESRDLLLEQMQRLGLSSDTARAPGCIQMFQTQAEAEQALRIAHQIGVKAQLTRAADQSLGRPAVYFPDDNSGDARRFGLALAKALDAQGVDIIYEAQALKPQISGSNIQLITSTGAMALDHLVIAAGVGSQDILRSLGLSLPTKAVRGWALDFDRPDGVALPDCPIMDATTRSALTVFEDRVRLSGLWGDGSHERLLSIWSEIAPNILKTLGAPVQRWTAERPVSDLGRPFIGATSVPRLWINAGHGHMGWTLCAGSGALLTRMILDGQTDPRFAFAA